ncbi:hypothetical protein [Kitasatospora sp. MAP5-34]|nr:hypothetical protein [Kitasatospora sp. MAP5-34]MDH6579077.1 uncharacterized protein YyaL (SSP411 family) [Kitasatospora sp. MAP5-34]
MNRLGDAASPYLRRHLVALDPEAFAGAARRGVPVLLSLWEMVAPGAGGW